MEKNDILKNFIDSEGRLKQWPAKRSKQLKALIYLAEKFETGKEYTEKEINQILNNWHLFEDHALLRRELVELGHLERTPTGSQYWKIRVDS